MNVRRFGQLIEWPPLPAVALLLLALLVVGCGSTDTEILAEGSHAPERIAGVAGKDYDPELVHVSYVSPSLMPDMVLQEAQSFAAEASDPPTFICDDEFYIPLSRMIAKRYRLEIKHQAYWKGCNIAAFRIPSGSSVTDIVAALKRDYPSLFRAVEPVYFGRASYEPDDPAWVASTNTNGGMWGQRLIKCEQAWDHSRGAPDMMIGVVDTGVRLTHEELSASVINPEVEFPQLIMDIANNDTSIEDNHGHGTAISSLICAAADNSLGILGVAFESRVLPVKISETAESASYAVMANGCILAAGAGADIVNLSWNGEFPSTVLADMVATLAENDVLLVNSAGNGSSNQELYPGAYPGCIVVGATNQSDTRASLSNWGPEVDVAAPGVDLRVAYFLNNSSYRTWDGTSFSAPIVAAAAALVWDLSPGLSLSEVRAALEDTGIIVGGFEPGLRRLDLAGVLLSAMNPYSLTGLVVTEHGQPVAGADLELDGSLNVETGADGLFRFEGLGSGNHSLAVEAAGLEFAGSPFAVEINDSSQHDLLVVATLDPAPAMAALTPEAGSLLNLTGDGSAELEITATGIENAQSVRFELDLPPYGPGAEDFSEVVDAAPFSTSLDLSTAQALNCRALLRVTPVTAEGWLGPATDHWLNLMFSRGDANADGKVNYHDLYGYQALLADPVPGGGYLPFHDSDLDGSISEADVSGIGYAYAGPTVDAPEVTGILPELVAPGVPTRIIPVVDGQLPLEFSWTFGPEAEPTTSDAVSPAVEYETGGWYTVELTVSNAYGSTDASFSLLVGNTMPPSAVLVGAADTVAPGEPLVLDASGSSMRSEPISAYSWDWESDGETDLVTTGPMVVHTFAQPGEYVVGLEVADTSGTTSSAQHEVLVEFN
jgi:hypothetical protein